MTPSVGWVREAASSASASLMFMRSECHAHQPKIDILEGRTDGYFSTCRGHHEGMKSELIRTEEIGGLTYADAVANWLAGDGDTQRIETCQAQEPGR